MDNCLFCKIIKGEIPSYKIYEDEFTFAFLDIADDFVGHTLVLPKTHTKNMLEANSEVINAVFNTVKKISKHYVDNCGYTGVNVICNNNESAEQSIAHFHVHIIPRKEDDGLSVFPKNDKQNANLAEIQQQLKLN